MDRARVKLGDKVMIPAVVEKIEYTTEGGVSYKVKPIITTWFDAGEIEALRESTDKYTNATTNLYDSRLAKDLIGISKEAEKLWTFEGVAESVAPKEMSLEEWQEIDRMVQGVAESATTTDCNYTCSDCKHQDKTYEQEPCHSCFNNDGAGYEPDTDCISRQQAIEVIEGVDWYRVNSKGELVHGSTSDEESWYRAEDIYKAIESLPPVTHDKRTETHGVCLDTISRQKANDKLKRLVNEMEGIFANIRMRNVDDSVCGLCEYDADHGLDGYANECPGFETDDCFKLNEKYRREWLDIEQ